MHPHARGDDDPASSRRRRPRRFTPTRVGTTLGWPALTTSPGARRFTPTRVGTTPLLRRALRPVRFTPTRVGTTTARAWPRLAPVGSPPRAWGRRPPASAAAIVSVHPHARGDDETSARRARRTPRPTRFTPTRVGTTFAGEPYARVAAISGSPPRAWGRRSAPARANGGVTVHRFTPTRVGTTAVCAPRRRGCVEHRFTPTRVGTTSCAGHGPRPPYGSPPPRGDDFVGAAATPLTADGSPPRAWGRR